MEYCPLPICKQVSGVYSPHTRSDPASLPERRHSNKPPLLSLLPHTLDKHSRHTAAPQRGYSQRVSIADSDFRSAVTTASTFVSVYFSGDVHQRSGKPLINFLAAIASLQV